MLPKHARWIVALLVVSAAAGSSLFSFAEDDLAPPERAGVIDAPTAEAEPDATKPPAPALLAPREEDDDPPAPAIAAKDSAGADAQAPSAEETLQRRDIEPVSAGVEAFSPAPGDEYPAVRRGSADQAATWLPSSEDEAGATDAVAGGPAPNEEPYELHFIGGIKTPPPGIEAEVLAKVADARAKGADLAAEATYGFVMIEGRLTPEREQAIADLGITLFQRHTYRSWKARVPLAAVEALGALPYVRWFGYATPEQKLEPALQEGMRLYGFSEAPSSFVIHVMDDDTTPEAFETPRQLADQSRPLYHPNGRMEKALVEAGLEVRHFDRGLRMFEVSGGHAGIGRVLAEDWVHFVEYEQTIRAHLDQSGPLVQSDEFWGGSYIGDGGVSVGIIDTGCWVSGSGHSDLNHINSCGVNYTSEGDAWTDLRGHGTHVAGIIGSNADCAPAGMYHGQAAGVGTGSPLARLRVAKTMDVTGSGASADFRDAMDWMAVVDPGSCTSTPKAHVVNNSWGSSCYSAAPVGTDATSLKADEQVYDENIVMVFSAGNGRDTPVAGACDGTEDYWGAGSIATPGAAKNVLTVGACADETQNVVGDRAWFSSQGATGDSRLKPDVNAPGCDDETQVANGTGNEIFAPDSDSACDMIGRCGTSMAAPHVTGIVATLMDHYSWLRNDPSLVKAWLMARAIPHNNSLAESRNAYGTGRVDAYVAHYDYAGANGWDGGSFHGAVDWDTWIYGDITVPAGTTRLVVVMAWDEAPASAGAAASVSYDLNLYADLAPFSADPDVGTYSSTSTVNNVEVIRVDSPTAGDYRIKVHNLDAPGIFSTALHVDVAWLAILGDTSPQPTLAITSTDACIQPNTDFDVTATASFGSWIGSCLHVETNALPAGVSIEDLDTIREDGTNFDYDADDTDVTLGSIHVGDSRAATWTFRSTTEGTKTISIDSDTDNAGTVTQIINVGVDGTAPGLPAFVSSTPATGIWTNDNTVFVDWTAATDDNCGVDGYGEFWTTSAVACPGNTKDIEEAPTSSTSAPLSDGTWYYALNTVDNADNWSASCTRIGPFRIDVTEPGLVTNLVCTSHTVNVWSADNTMDFAWTAATDNLSGVDGYGINLTTGATGIPSAAKDIEEVTTYTTPGRPSNALHYFNIRTVDNAGNWDAEFASIGPFRIDVTAPTAPENLTSSSHGIGAYSSDRTVDVEWTTGTDNHSGVAGYSCAWTPAVNTTPDNVIETDELLTTSPSLADGDWYFHVRTVDDVGNASTAAHLGPFRIDGTLPTNPTLASSTHTVGDCSNVCVITMTWSGASGAPVLPKALASGVAGYSYLFTTAPASAPDQVIDTALETATSLCLAGGAWFFHLRTADNAGNWSGAVHMGPFPIDTTAPSNPASASSSSHTLSAWSNDRTIDVVWDAGADAGCGVAGYSTAWTLVPGTVPDATIETAGTGETSAPLADGASWHFHVRAVDEAGNVPTSARHLGPFMIDATAPAAEVTSPDGGENLAGGSVTNVTFIASDALSGVQNVTVEFSDDGGASWPVEVYNGPDPSGSVPWTVPDQATLSGRIRVRVRDVAGNTVEDVSDGDFTITPTTTSTPAAVPGAYALNANVPNPFNPVTTISYDLPEATEVTLEVFDASGRRIATLAAGQRPAGRHSVVWDGRDMTGRTVGSGMYFYRLEAGAFMETRKMVVMK